MPGICDHPNLWIVFSLGGFGSHLDNEALLVSNKYKILVIKEEGDTLQVSQAYDQLVAKQDNVWPRQMLDIIKTYIRRPIDQWTLILIVNQALNEVGKGDAWRASFIRVNFCPSMHLPLKEWLKRGELDGNVAAADLSLNHAQFCSMSCLLYGEI